MAWLTSRQFTRSVDFKMGSPGAHWKLDAVGCGYDVGVGVVGVYDGVGVFFALEIGRVGYIQPFAGSIHQRCGGKHHQYGQE